MAAKNDVSGREKGGESGAGEEIQRWTAGRKAAIVLDLIKGKVTAADVARQHDLTVAEVESWIDRFVEGGREGLRTVPKDADARFDAERLQLLAKVGELTLQVDALKKKSNSQAINALTTLNGTAQPFAAPPPSLPSLRRCPHATPSSPGDCDPSDPRSSPRPHAAPSSTAR